MSPDLTGIRLAANAALRLRPGETVSLEVLRRIGGNRWAVKLGGRPATAWSPAELVPGRSLRARVDGGGDPAAGDPLLLRLLALPRSSILHWLRQAGLPADGLSQRIVQALLNQRAALEPLAIGRVRRAMAGRSPTDTRRIRLLVMVLAKGLDPQSPGIDRLLALLDGRPDGRPAPDRREPEKKDDSDEAAPRQTVLASAGLPPSADPAGAVCALWREAIARAGQGGESSLQAFNHLGARDETWIVIPYRLAGGGTSLRGSLRLLYNRFQRQAQRFILEAGSEDGNRWTFALDRPAGRAARLRLFCSDLDLRTRAEGALANLAIKLRNLGVVVDDTVLEYSGFDGFSFPGEETTLRGVDTVR